MSESGGESEKLSKENGLHDRASIQGGDTQTQVPDVSNDGIRRASGPGSIWNSWRHGTATNGGDQRESAPLSGYQPAGRGRNMKVLKPMKSASSSTSTRTGVAYEPAPLPRSSGELRRKSQTAAEGSGGSAIRWEPKRTSISGVESKAVLTNREVRSVSSTPRTSTNPVGGASAFSWMTPESKPKTPTTAPD